jgi:hypothetical protein
MTEAQLGSHQAALHREVCALQAQLSSEGKARQAAHQAALDELSLGVNDRLVQASGLEVLKEEVRPSLPCTVSRCVSLTGSPAANPTPPPTLRLARCLRLPLSPPRSPPPPSPFFSLTAPSPLPLPGEGEPGGGDAAEREGAAGDKRGGGGALGPDGRDTRAASPDRGTSLLGSGLIHELLHQTEVPHCWGRG